MFGWRCASWRFVSTRHCMRLVADEVAVDTSGWNEPSHSPKVAFVASKQGPSQGMLWRLVRSLLQSLTWLICSLQSHLHPTSSPCSLPLDLIWWLEVKCWSKGRQRFDLESWHHGILQLPYYEFHLTFTLSLLMCACLWWMMMFEQCLMPSGCTNWALRCDLLVEGISTISSRRIYFICISNQVVQMWIRLTNVRECCYVAIGYCSVENVL